MSTKATPESVEAFKKLLRKWGFPQEAYQALEVLFRQAMMQSAASHYEYQNEAIDKELGNATLRPEQRLAKCRSLIEAFHTRMPDIEYGFGEVINAQFADDEATIERYEILTQRLAQIENELRGFLPPETLSAWIKDGRRLLIEKIQIEKRSAGHYIAFDEGTGAVIRNEPLHEYFRNYIANAWGVFNPVFRRIAERNDKPKKSDFTSFLSAKIRREHPEVTDIGVFTPSMISGRIKKCQIETLYGKAPEKIGLVSATFFEHLFEEYGL